MRITNLNLINANVCLYEISTRSYIDFACTTLTALNKTQRQKLEVIQNRCLQYARRAVDYTCISNNDLRSCYNIISVKQRILTLEDSWWRKVSF